LEASHSAFEDVFVLLVAIQSFAHAVEAYVEGQSAPWPNDDTVVLPSRQTGMMLTWSPAPVMHLICRNTKPTVIQFTETKTPPSAHPPIEAGRHPDGSQLGDIEPFFSSLSKAMFTNYFERHKYRIVTSFPNRTWPDVWNFGRVVRDAFSHNGRIKIKHERDSPVHWRGLTYAQTDNGKYLDLSLSPGDLIYLMLDMDASLR
jgi:hypothetical protein